MDDDSKKPLFDRKAPPVDLMARTKQEKDADTQALLEMVAETRKEMASLCRKEAKGLKEDLQEEANTLNEELTKISKGLVKGVKEEQESANKSVTAALTWVKSLSPEGEFPKKMGDQFKKALDIEKARNMVWLVVLSLSLCLGAFAGIVKVGTMFNESATQQGYATSFMMMQLNNVEAQWNGKKVWLYYDVKATTKKDYKEGRVVLFSPKGR